MKVLNCDVVNGIQTLLYDLRDIPSSFLYRSTSSWSAESGANIRTVLQVYLIDRGFWTKKLGMLGGDVNRAAEAAVLQSYNRAHSVIMIKREQDRPTFRRKVCRTKMQRLRIRYLDKYGKCSRKNSIIKVSHAIVYNHYIL